jgi:arsenate reductase-like glutaredoxin family protein
VEVQVFGIQNDAAVRKALRFFAERRVRTHFVDFKVRAPSPGELRRFADRFGAEALVDRTSRAFAQHGLQTARYGAARWLEILAGDPLLLKLPLVRWGRELAIGHDEVAWKRWVVEGK